MRALIAKAYLALLGGGLVACATDAESGRRGCAGPRRICDLHGQPKLDDRRVAGDNPDHDGSSPADRPCAGRHFGAHDDGAVRYPGSSDYIHAAYDAWAAGDRTGAASVAQPASVDTLFGRTWTQADAWSFARCEGAAGSVFCVWHDRARSC